MAGYLRAVTSVCRSSAAAFGKNPGALSPALCQQQRNCKCPPATFPPLEAPSAPHIPLIVPLLPNPGEVICHLLSSIALTSNTAPAHSGGGEGGMRGSARGGRSSAHRGRGGAIIRGPRAATEIPETAAASACVQCVPGEAGGRQGIPAPSTPRSTPHCTLHPMHAIDCSCAVHR